MDYILDSLPLFIGLLGFYFYALIYPKDKILSAVTGVLLAFSLESGYLIFGFYYGKHFPLDKAFIFIFPLLALAFLYVLRFRTENQKAEIPFWGKLLLAFPAIAWIGLYVFGYTLKEADVDELWLQRISYIMIAGWALLYAALGMRRWEYWRNVQKEERRLLYSLWWELAIFGVLMIILFVGVAPNPAIELSFFVFKSTEIALSVTLFFYLFNRYRLQLEEQREKRLSGPEKWKDLKNNHTETEEYKPLEKGKNENLTLTLSDKDKIMFFFDHKNDFLDTDFKIRNLAQAVSIPEHQLSAIFKEELQTTFIHFLNRKRISYACRQIEDSEDKIIVSELSLTCGYKSRSSFYHHFKQITGKSVTQFIKERKG